MKYNIVKIMILANSCIIAMSFVYVAITYAAWDVTIIFFVIFILAIITILIYNHTESKRLAEMKRISGILAKAKKTAQFLLNEQKKKVEASENGDTSVKTPIVKKDNMQFPTLGNIGEDEHDELTECERNYRNYLKSDSPHK